MDRLTSERIACFKQIGLDRSNRQKRRSKKPEKTNRMTIGPGPSTVSKFFGEILHPGPGVEAL